MKKTAIFLTILWAVLTLAAWTAPTKAVDDAERRPLSPRPAFRLEQVLSGRFQTDFESGSLDQFPFRQSFRRLKALFHRNVLGQRDDHGIYLCQGHAVAQVYPMKADSLDHALSRFSYLHRGFLQGSSAKMAVIPDKNYYLGEESGQLSLNYDALFRQVEEALPWAEQIDLTGSLTAEDFYRTDAHWRQERLFGAAKAICESLGVSPPKPEDYRVETLERPFYGVYYGQAALPMEPDELSLLRSPLLDECTVFDYESGQTLGIYDESKKTGKDLYEIFLSGPRSLLTVRNPNGTAGRELLIFRDSFASAIAPLLLSDYETVTLIDIRYIQIDLLDRFVDFHGQDVLLLYSVPVLNSGETIK